MAKKVVAEVKLQIPAGQANPSPPVGPALGQRGVNIMEFCKAVQRADPGAAGLDHPGDHHRLCGPVVHVRHQDAARVHSLEARGGRREGVGRSRTRTRSGTVTQQQVREIAQLKTPGSHRRQSRGGDAHRRRHRSQHGHRGRGLTWRSTARNIAREPRRSTAQKQYTLDGCRQARGAMRRFAKFDETVEVAVRLGVDPRQADQNVRGTVILPHGTGKNVRVLVVAKGEKVKEAESAGR